MPAKYLMIARELELLVRRSGQMRKLPTEAALCRQYGCSRQTIRAALAVLEEKGLILRRQGSGSFVTRSAAKSSRQIAVLLPDREEYLYPALLRTIRKEAAEAGFTAVCLETGGSWQREREHLTGLLRNPPAGVILEPICDVLGCGSEEPLAQLTGQGVPLVYLNGRYAAPGCRVQADEMMGTGILMSHLAAKGHKKIAAILRCDNSLGLERFRGCLHGAREWGIDFSPENCLWLSAQERLRLLEGDNTLLTRFLRQCRPGCTAVVCQNDEIAFRLLRLLGASRTRMAVVSFDDSYLARDASITSLGFDGITPGTAAIQALLQRIGGRESLPPPLHWKLHVRESG